MAQAVGTAGQGNSCSSGGGRQTIPQDAWQEEQLYLLNQASWENDPEVQAVL